jgi:transcriptional regulator with XRE-family HTH domain
MHRKERGLTLRLVSERAGISEGFLSQVENNVNSPSVETLRNICNAIGVNAGDLLNLIDQQEKLTLIKKADLKEVDIPHTGFATRRFSPPEMRTVIDAAILFLDPGGTIPVRKESKNGQEILCILQGTLELVHGDRTVQMEQGDTIHFWAEPKRQLISNKGKRRAIALWVGTL